jgi:hypothetical protein
LGALAACGTPDSQAGRTIATGTVNQHSGNYSIQVSPAEFTPGQKVQVIVTLSGPLHYETGCLVTPLVLHITDSDGNDVWDTPFRPLSCGDTEVAPGVAEQDLYAGETATFTEVWPSSDSLAKGTYYIHTTFRSVLTNQGGRQAHQLPVVQVRVVYP